MNRADWYAVKHGGGWRKARVKSRCDMTRDGLRCENLILPGNEYFDTNARNFTAKCPCQKIKLCASCATEELK